ncbi:M28 family peptidase [Draconibacterium sp. IB214405]|uniref:M20/M25/M40 family metallo-hydrolase n=1 Tax=Draconibacterium sp. IB214405 TaxID=3097352 RepID=UPI002A141CEB|nr:M20/M25/M40 family metallo-hydrolase [Draconibacterium sp. IB214405]MDX8339914.1 M28 family peptidase [Draconibacterium sp. IB214405]
MKNFVFAALVILLTSCGVKFDKEITLDDIKENINYLASDSLKGRKSGDEGDLLAAQFIAAKFEAAGLQLLYDNGFQEFNLVTSAEVKPGNELFVENTSYAVETDFLPYAFSANTEVEAGVVLAGYGLDVDRDSLQWDDFENVDVSGKWILVLQGDPDLDNPNSPYLEFSSERAKALTASDKNAAGIIFVAGPKFSEEDELSPLFFDKNSSRFTIPVIQVTRAVANKLLESEGKTISGLETEMLEQNSGLNIELATTVKAKVNIGLKETSTRNVAALLPGTDENLKDEYVVLGAHFDHLGMGGPGSGSRAIDTIAIHNGADDNASGVSAVIQLAEKLAGEKMNKRSVLFVAFAAEEMGLIGSKEFTAKPPVETDKMVGMFNFDMVGRLDDESKTLSIGGTQTSKETEQLLNDLNPGFELALSGEGIGPSDHASFYLQNIPVFFISTGAHPDYHTPQDDAELINYEGAQKVMEYSAALVDDVVNRAEKLTFQEAGSKFQRSRGGRFKVTLGVMPDFAGVEKRGMRVDAVSKDKPAYKGGMKNGDIIIAIDGKKVGNIYEYMERLNNMEAGQTISVDVLRDDKKVVLIVQL